MAILNDSSTSTLPSGALPAEDAAGEVVAAIAQAQTISPDEIALYDRQIRLWGVKAQEKIRNANILIVTLKALGNEIAKNLVLAGIGTLTIVDHEVVMEHDLGSQFLINEADIGKNRAEAALPQLAKLNPRVTLHVDTTDIRSKSREFFQQFDITIATDLDFDESARINASTRMAKRPCYIAGTHGFYGFIFADLISHDYVIEREKSNRPTAMHAETTTRTVIAASTKKQNGKVIEMVTKRELYSPILLANTSPLPQEILNNRRKLRQVHPLLSCMRALWDFQRASGRLPSHSKEDLVLFTTMATEKHKELQIPPDTLKSEFLRSFMQSVGTEIAPVTAFVGGQLAQDVINVLGQREQPIQNFLFFDGEEAKGPIYPLHPIF